MKFYRLYRSVAKHALRQYFTSPTRHTASPGTLLKHKQPWRKRVVDAIQTRVLNNSQSQQDDQPTQTEELVPKKGGTSVAWKWFGFKKTDTDQTTVICKPVRYAAARSQQRTPTRIQGKFNAIMNVCHQLKVQELTLQELTLVCQALVKQISLLTRHIDIAN